LIDLCSHRLAITEFIEHFRGHAEMLNAVTPNLYRKILYATALDPLGRAAFGGTETHGNRITRLLDELIEWDEKHRVSLPQLALVLSEKDRTSGQLCQRVIELLSQWTPGEVIYLSASPHISELSPLTIPEEGSLLKAATYAQLFYTYRNNLIHEFREPGYGVEWSAGKEPYYHAMIDNPWQLVFPVGFFARLYQEVLSGLEAFLVRTDIDPYSQFEFGSRWRAR
jgi:hypothetical protein